MKKMNYKHDATIGVRLQSDVSLKFKKIAAETNDTPSNLIRLLAERYVAAFEKHGRRVIYPPEYRLYAVLEKEQESHDPQKTEKKSNQRTA